MTFLETDNAVSEPIESRSLSPNFSPEALGNIAQVLDLGETLFEAFAADARRKLGSYPEGDKAAQTMTEIFRALRINVGLVDSAEHE